MEKRQKNMYGLKRLLEIEEERKRKKAERERIKKEKEKEKKRLKRIEKKKKQSKKNNRKQYLKRRQSELDKRKAEGDEYAYYSVYITKNRKRIRYVGASWWKNDAYKIYTDAIEKNRKKAVFPKTVATNRKEGAHDTIDVKYEILLIKKTKEHEDTVKSFRNEQGKFVDNIITDWKDHVIVDKSDWYVEQTFGVYGYNPRTDRKTYTFILENILLNNDDVGDEMKRVMVFKNRVIIEYLNDFDFVTCYDNEEARTMYNMLENDVLKRKKKYIAFMGETKSEKWVDRIQEKTGWNRLSILHKSTSN